MVNHIKAYLIQHRSVSIPGLGTIYVERTPARSDFVNRQILPPSYHFRFDKYFDTPSREFFGFLSLKKGVPEFEAIKVYNEWAQQLRGSITGVSQTASLEGIGTLMRDSSGEVVFEPALEPPTYTSAVPAERIIRVNASHSVLVGDRESNSTEMADYLQETHKEKTSWWIYALIVASIALIALLFGYFRGASTGFFGNQQKIESK